MSIGNATRPLSIAIASIVILAGSAFAQDVKWDISEATATTEPQRAFGGMTVAVGGPTRYDGPVIPRSPKEQYVIVSLKTTGGAQGVNLLAQKFSVNGSRGPGFVQQGSAGVWYALESRGYLGLAPGCEVPCQPKLLFVVQKDKLEKAVLRAGGQEFRLSKLLGNAGSAGPRAGVDPPKVSVDRNKALNEAWSRGAKAVDTRQWNEAITALTSATELDPSQPVIWAKLSSAYEGAALTKTGAERAELLNKAVGSLKKATELKPDEAGYQAKYKVLTSQVGGSPSSEIASPAATADLRSAKVEVTIQDDRGRFIPGIPKGNFRITQNGLTREISGVSNIEAPNRAYLLAFEPKDDVTSENIKVDLVNPQTGKPLSMKDEKGKPVKFEIIVKPVTELSAVKHTVAPKGVEATIALARLLPSVKTSRANAGDMRPPSGSVFLWVMVEIAKAGTVPLVLDVYNVSVKDAAGKAYPVFGILSSPVETPIVANAFRPVGTGGPGGEAWVETFGNSSGDGFEFRLNNPVGGRDASARLTLKKLPTKFSLFFVVPAAAASYTLSGLVPSELSTGELSVAVQR